MANFYQDNEDLRFYVEQWIDWEPLVRMTEHDFSYEDGFENTAEAVEFYKEILELVGGFIGDEIDPYVAQMEREGPRFEDGEVHFPARLDAIFKQLGELGLHGLCVPRELGGMNAPLLVYMFQIAMMGRADVSISAHHSFHGGIALVLLVMSIAEGSTTFDPESGHITGTRFQREIEAIIAGESWGSMDITEADAGSDMAALRARAELGEDGIWRLSGTKIFITSGHGDYHIVIARTEFDDPEKSGLNALSTFLVPAWTQDAQGNRVRVAKVERIEDKLGHHLSATCAVNFDQAPAELLGERGDGFRQMLLLMNNARIGIGFESLGLCEAAYRMARAYAAERHSMGKSIDQHEMIADYLDQMDIDIIGIRAMAVEAAYHEEIAQKYKIQAARLDDPAAVNRANRRYKRHQWKARVITPLLKYHAAEKAVQMAQRAIQILGGVGYTSEYGAEKLLRDALVMPIYEGTSQIQALMAMKDSMSYIMKNPQAFVKRVAQARWKSVSERDLLARRVARIESLALSAQQHLVTRTAVDKFKSLSGVPIIDWPRELSKEWDPKHDFAHAMLHAERLTKLLTDLKICELLYAQQLKHPQRRELLERYLERAEPRCRFLHDEITTTGERLIHRLHPERPMQGAAE